MHSAGNNDHQNYDEDSGFAALLQSPFFNQFLKPLILTVGSYFSAKAAVFIGSSLHQGFKENVKPMWEDYNLIEKYGEYVVVTNASDKLGAEFAKQFARKGHSLLLIRIKDDYYFDQELPSIEKCIQPGKELRVLTKNEKEGDFLTYQKIEAAFEGVDIKGKIGIILNNSGIVGNTDGNFLTVTPMAVLDDVHKRLVDFLMITKTILRIFVQNKKGLIVTVTPPISCRPFNGRGFFPVSMRQFAQEFNTTVRSELSRVQEVEKNIKLESLNPGYICTCENGCSYSTLNPTAEKFVKSAFRVMGKVNSSSGYWYYSLQDFCRAFVPDIVTSLLKALSQEIVKSSTTQSTYMVPILPQTGDASAWKTIVSKDGKEHKKQSDYKPIPSSDDTKAKPKPPEHSTISMDEETKLIKTEYNWNDA